MNIIKKTFALFLSSLILTTISVPTAKAAPKIKSKNKPTITVTISSPTSIKIKWKKFSDAEGYVIYRKTSKNGKWKNIKTTSSTSYTNKNLKVNKKYYYRVRAYAKLGIKKKYSPYSSTKSATTYVSKPTIKVSKTTTSSIKLSIKKNKGADGVVIYRKTSKNGSWKKLKKTSSTSYTNKSLKSNKTYYYRVKAYEKVGKKYYYSKYTSTIKGKTKAKTTKPIVSVTQPQNITINGVTIKAGNSITENLDFGGKTFTMAIDAHPQYNSNTFKRTVAAFEDKFNCNINIITLSFGTYNKQIAQMVATGSAPEICYAHGSMFPECAINNLYNPLNNTITTGDLMDNNNPTAGGIDPQKTSYFVYKNKIYGTCNFSSCFPYVIYYNKRQMADVGFSGSKDPRTMAERGQWTFAVITAMGKKLTNATKDIYFLSNSFSGRGVPLSYGAPIVIFKNGVYKENISSLGYIEAMGYMQRIAVGANRIMEPRDSTHSYNSYATLLKGSSYLYAEESYKYLDISKDVKTSSAFNRSTDNIGITTMPLGATNTTNSYPTGWLTAICSGKGTDPRVAVAWDVFRSSYKDPVRDSNALSTKDQAFVNNLLKGNICCEVGVFSTSENTTLTLTEGGIIPNILRGADVTQCIISVKDQMNNCIKNTIN